MKCKNDSPRVPQSVNPLRVKSATSTLRRSGIVRWSTGAALTLALFATVTVSPCQASAPVLYLGGTPQQLGALHTECPTNCHILEREIVFNSHIPGQADPMLVPANGRLVGVTLKMGDPGETSLGAALNTYGDPTFRVAILAPPSAPDTNVVAAETTNIGSATDPLLLGEEEQFPIQPIPVSAGERIALVVPTWVPAVVESEAESEQLVSVQGACGAAQPFASGEPALGSTIYFNCGVASSRVAYDAIVLPESTREIPKLRFAYRFGRRGRYRVLNSISVGPLLSREKIQFRCPDCRTLPSRVHAYRRGRVKRFYDLGIVPPHAHEETYLEFWANAPGMVSREVDIDLGFRHPRVKETCRAPGPFRIFTEAQLKEPVIGC